MAAQCFAPFVLLTRPGPQSDRFAASLRARAPGMAIVTSPLMAPRFLAPDLPQGPWQAVILTSETGALAAGRCKPDLPDLAFCVGPRTAKVAARQGFAALSADGDAEALLALILSQPQAPLLHLRGREARGDLARRLSAHGRPTAETVVYAQEEQALTPQARTLLAGRDPVLCPVFSPRAAQILRAACLRDHLGAPITLVAMSAAVAAAAGDLPVRCVIAPQPTGESMLETLLAEWVAGQNA